MAQNSATALKFEGQEEMHEAKTRKEALQSVLSGDSLTARHDHVVSPMVHNAANHLIQNKRTLDIELYGFPYEVLEQATEQLEGAGLSSQMAGQLLEALEEYILNMGTDFTRAAKAKPLYARFKVTDKEPEELPDCEQSQATFLDGMRSYGGDSANVVRYMSLYGPKSTSSQGVDMDAMFASKNMGLFVFFGSPSNEGVKGFDGVDNALMNAMQSGVGGAMSEEEMAELIEMIQNGDLSPEALEILENMAELAQLTDAALTPDAIENVEEQIANLTQEISEQIAAAIESGALPQSLISASIQILTEASPNNVLSSILDNAATLDIEAGNDNSDVTAEIEALIEQLTELAGSEGLDQAGLDTITAQIEALNAALSNEGADLSAVLADIKTELSAMAASEGMPDAIYEQISEILPAVAEISQEIAVPTSLLDQLPELAELGAEELLEVLQELAQTENLPPELQELLEQIDIDNLTPETLAEALSAKADSDLAQTVQALVVALNNPEVQSLLPQEVLTQVNQFLGGNEALVEAVSTHVVVQNIETILEAGDLDAAQVQELQNIVEDLKSGTETINTIDSTTLQAVAPQLDSATFTALENTITTIEVANAGSPTVVPENSNLGTPQITGHMQSMTPPVSPAIAIAQAVFVQQQSTVITTQPDFPTPAVAQSLSLIAQDVKQAGNPAQAELLKASANIVNNFEKKGAEPTVKDVVETVQKINEVIQKNETSAEKISPAQQAELSAVKDKLIATLPADIKNDLQPALEKPFSENQNVPADHSANDAANKPEETKFEDPCSSCGGGKCPGCGTDFAAVVNKSTEGMEIISTIDVTNANDDKVAVDEAVNDPVGGPEDKPTEETKFQSDCDSCGGGKCPGCGTDFAAVVNKSTDGMDIITTADNDNTAVVETVNDPVGGPEDKPAEEAKFELDCSSCGGGKCPGCGTDFAAVVNKSTEGMEIIVAADNQNTPISIPPKVAVKSLG